MARNKSDQFDAQRVFAEAIVGMQIADWIVVDPPHSEWLSVLHETSDAAGGSVQPELSCPSNNGFRSEEEFRDEFAPVHAWNPVVPSFPPSQSVLKRLVIDVVENIPPDSLFQIVEKIFVEQEEPRRVRQWPECLDDILRNAGTCAFVDLNRVASAQQEIRGEVVQSSDIVARFDPDLAYQGGHQFFRLRISGACKLPVVRDCGGIESFKHCYCHFRRSPSACHRVPNGMSQYRQRARDHLSNCHCDAFFPFGTWESRWRAVAADVFIPHPGVVPRAEKLCEL